MMKTETKIQNLIAIIRNTSPIVKVLNRLRQLQKWEINGNSKRIWTQICIILFRKQRQKKQEKGPALEFY